jgi:hypothetical protein
MIRNAFAYAPQISQFDLATVAFKRQVRNLSYVPVGRTSRIRPVGLLRSRGMGWG